MNEELDKHRLSVQRGMLDFFHELTGLPVGLYEVVRGQLDPNPVISATSFRSYEGHCTYLHDIPGARAMCDADQCLRAKQVLSNPGEPLSVCHAGLWNAAIPISVSGEPRAAVLFGEMRIADSDKEALSESRHQALVKRLGLSPEQAATLHAKLTDCKQKTPEEITHLLDRIRQFEKCLYSLFEEQERVKHGVENVSHEIYIRLQAVIAEAENLSTEPAVTTELSGYAQRILHAALALNTIVQTLDDFTEDYRFKSERISDLLEEAQDTYAPEASRKNLDIRLDITDGLRADLSKPHMQMALNNLMHNAVKYSFSTVSTSSRRYVSVKARIDQFGENVFITFTNYGVGILPHEFPNLFQSGFQGELTKGEYRPGAGRGLSVVKRVIDAHKGKISVDSSLMSEGATVYRKPHLTKFRISLPIRRTKG